MIQHQKLNNIIGWSIFVLTLIVYILTLEPSVSYWDCGEFIATSYKLQIGHPPGAPFYNLVARVVSIIAPNKQLVAIFINAFSAIASAATILFLYWTIVRLVNRIKGANAIQGMFAGAIGALTFAFTDTFWFSAVEAEVYAFSLLFTAVIFWAILKWETIANEPYADRWIVLIAFLVGLSIGVHLLNLLAIPAIALIWYFKKYKPNTKGIVFTLLLSFATILVLMFVVVQGVPQLAKLFEILLVNSFGLPYNSGFILMILLIALGIVTLLIWANKTGAHLTSLLTNCLLVIFIGYGSYAMVIIRSNGDPGIDQNNPENAYSLVNYLNRSQYGSAPLLYGQYYSAPIRSLKEGSPLYLARNGKYKKVDGTLDYEFDWRFNTFFPRMYSTTGSHVRAYKQWSGNDSTTLNIEGEKMEKPTFKANLRYFFNYQIGFMYFRYFMWNFSGRQNDLQGYGGPKEGNWITGITFIDQLRLGFDGKLPKTLANPESYNPYYILPLLLGIVGLLFHFKRKKSDFGVVLLLFIMTGLAIVVYLNQTPYQPRERDYAYVGSFYAFSIWIGFGAAALFEATRKIKVKYLSSVPFVITGMLPVMVLAVNYDDHDRSGRFVARDYAENYLNSCEENGILFTYADNDTFPLWFIQDVEGVREDVRICNTTLLNMDWYIDQMKQALYNSKPLPIKMTQEQYEGNVRNSCFIQDRLKKSIELDSLMEFILSDNDRTKITTRSGQKYDFLPSHSVKIEIDKAYLKKMNLFQNHNEEIEDSMVFRIKGNYLSKSDLIILDILNNNNWERPIYFDFSAVQTTNIDLKDYLQLEGFAYRLVPYRSKREGGVLIDSDILYHRLIDQFVWGNTRDPRILVDENLQKNISAVQVKPTFNRLAAKLIEENQFEKASNVIHKLLEILPLEQYETNVNDYYTARNLYLIDEKELADSVLLKIIDHSKTNVKFYQLMPMYHRNAINSEMQLIKQIFALVQTMDRVELSDKIAAEISLLEKQN